MKKDTPFAISVTATALLIGTGFFSHAEAETIVGVTQENYDDDRRPLCAATRMNPAVYGSLPADACALGTQGSNGPDRITKNTYDAAGQLTEIDQAYGTSLQRAYARYAYTNNGLKQTETDANGNKTTHIYDVFDRLSQLQYPSTTIGSGTSNANDYEAWGYDANGNKTSWRRRDGQTVTYSYDSQNRETLKDVPGGTSTDVYTNYDGQGRILWRRFGSASGSGVSYTYDGLGRLSSVTDYNGRTIWYSYNQASARTQLTFPDINNFTYALDNVNRISTIGLNASSGLASLSYDSLGRLTGVGRLGGSTSYGYDNFSRLTSMSNDLNGTSYDIGWTFVYNPAGQLYTSTASSTTYNYKETVNSTDNATFDGLNRDSRLVGATSACPVGGYDARQNLICDSLQTPNRTFTYDAENRMLSGVSTSANVRMTYDPEGRLAKYSTDGGATWFTQLYDGVTLIAPYDTSGVMSARYVHGGDTDNPLIWMVGSGTTTMRPLYSDYQGSVIADTDGAGNLVDLYKYGPYGEPKDAGNTEFWGGSAFRYTGQIALPQLQLYYYKARVYDPRWGRFLQTDPVGSKDDLDLYAYTHDDPVNASDPTGLCEVVDGKEVGLCGNDNAARAAIDVALHDSSATATARAESQLVRDGVRAGVSSSWESKTTTNVPQDPSKPYTVSIKISTNEKATVITDSGEIKSIRPSMTEVIEHESDHVTQVYPQDRQDSITDTGHQENDPREAHATNTENDYLKSSGAGYVRYCYNCSVSDAKRERGDDQ